MVLCFAAQSKHDFLHMLGFVHKYYGDGLPQMLHVEGHLHHLILIKLKQLLYPFKRHESTTNTAPLRQWHGANREIKQIKIFAETLRLLMCGNAKALHHL